MSRAFHEITYTAPLSTPVELDAYHAPSSGEWRLFVFPGTPCNKFLFQRFLRVAPPNLDVVVISRPGFAKGHSAPVLDFDEQVAAIKPFLPGAFLGGGEFGDKKIVSLGVSYGGELALKAALDFPDFVKGAVTVAALIEEPHDYALMLEKFASEIDERGAGKFIEPIAPSRWINVRAEVAGRRNQIGLVLDRLKDFEHPVEIVHGDFDAIVPRSNADKLASHLSKASLGTVDIVPGGTHYLELQYPRRVYQAVQRVIDRVGEQE